MSLINHQIVEYAIAAGESVTIATYATYIHCLASTARFKLQIDAGAEVDWEAGLGYRTDAGHFDQVRIVNPSAAVLTVKMSLGAGQIDDRRLGLAEPVKIDAPDVLATASDVLVPAGASALVLAASAVRRQAYIALPLAAPREVRVGDSAVGPARGLELPPGQRVVLQVASDVYAHNPHSAAIAVTVMELTD